MAAATATTSSTTPAPLTTLRSTYIAGAPWSWGVCSLHGQVGRTNGGPDPRKRPERPPAGPACVHQ
jgi:hypothetical protein